MNKKFTTSQNNTFTVDYSCSMPAGYGHQKIEVTIVDEQGNVETFSEVTNFIPGIDRANELEG